MWSLHFHGNLLSPRPFSLDWSFFCNLTGFPSIFFPSETCSLFINHYRTLKIYSRARYPPWNNFPLWLPKIFTRSMRFNDQVLAFFLASSNTNFPFVCNATINLSLSSLPWTWGASSKLKDLCSRWCLSTSFCPCVINWLIGSFPLGLFRCQLLRICS